MSIAAVENKIGHIQTKTREGQHPRPIQFYGVGKIQDMLDSELHRLNDMRLLPLSFGGYGIVGQSPDGSRVIKHGRNSENEFKVYMHIQALAPQYLPLPVTLRRYPPYDYYALEMMNAGPTLSEMQNASFTTWEALLCTLQWIHFLLLCGDRVLFQDQQNENLCLRWRGASIELRFIDVGLWQLPPWNGGTELSELPADILSLNIDSMREWCPFASEEATQHPLWKNAKCAADLVALAQWMRILTGNRSYADADAEVYACRARRRVLIHQIREAAAQCDAQLA